MCCIGTFLNIKRDVTNNNASNSSADFAGIDPNLIRKKLNLTIEEEGMIIQEISKYGIKMYEDGSYISFKEEQDYYYITLGELKNKGYAEIENLLFNCKDNDTIIYFYKNKDTYNFIDYPIAVKYYCS